MDSLEFSEEEIQQQLEHLGYKNISKEKLQEFKKDLDQLIHSGEWKTLTSPDNSTIISPNTSPPAFTKEKVGRYMFKESSEGFFLHPQNRDHDVRVLSPQNRVFAPESVRFDSYARHTIAPKPPGEVGRPNRLQTETDPDETLQTDSYMSTPGSGQGRRFVKRKVLRKHKGQSLVCDESVYSEDSALSHLLLLGSHSLHISCKMYKIQQEDGNDSTNSSFWSDKESDKEESETENGFNQKGIKMESIPGEKDEAGLSKEQDKYSSSEEMIECFVENHNSPTSPGNACKETLDDKHMEKQEQNVGKGSDNSDSNDSQERRVEMVRQTEKDLDRNVPESEEKDSSNGGDSSEIAETSSDDEEDNGVRKAMKSGKSSRESSKNERKKWKDLSDDSSINAETTSEDENEEETRTRFKFSSNHSGGSKMSGGERCEKNMDFRYGRSESRQSSSGDVDKEEVSPEGEQEMSQEDHKAAKSDEDICKDGEMLEKSSYHSGLKMEKATKLMSQKFTKNIQNLKKQDEKLTMRVKEETRSILDENEFSQESSDANASSENVESGTDLDEEMVIKNQEEVLEEGYNCTEGSKESSSENEERQTSGEEDTHMEALEGQKLKNFDFSDNSLDHRSSSNDNESDDLEEDTNINRDNIMARNFSQENGQNSKGQEKQPTSGEGDTCMEASHGPKNVCDFHQESPDNERDYNNFRDVVQSSSENGQEKELPTETKLSKDIGLDNVKTSSNDSGVKDFQNRKRLKKQKNFYDDNSGAEDTSSSERNSETSGNSSTDKEEAEIQSKQSEPATSIKGSVVNEKTLIKSSSENCEAGSNDENDILTKNEEAKSSSDNEKTNIRVTQDSSESTSENKLGFQAEETIMTTMQSEKPQIVDDFWDNNSDVASPSTDKNENKFGKGEDIQDGGKKHVKMQSNEDEILQDFSEGTPGIVSESDNECCTSDGFEKNVKTEGGISRQGSKSSVACAKGDQQDVMVEAMAEKDIAKNEEDCKNDQKAKQCESLATENLENGGNFEEVLHRCTKTELAATSEEERVDTILENSKNVDNLVEGTSKRSLDKEDQNECIDLVEASLLNVEPSGNKDEKVEIKDYSDKFKDHLQEEMLDKLTNGVQVSSENVFRVTRDSKPSYNIERNAQNCEASQDGSEEIERWFEGETFAAKDATIIQESDFERQDLDRVNVDDEASTSVSPATSLLTSGYGTYRSEKQDGGHSVEDDRLTITEFDKDSLYSFGVCEQEESHNLAKSNKFAQEKEDIDGEMEAEDEFWDGTKSENGTECEQGGKVEAELCLEKSNEEDSSNMDIKFIDSEVDPSGTSHQRMYEEWEGNLRPPIEGASCLEDRLADLHLSASVQHESENDDLTSHSESPSSETLSEGAFESYVRGMSRSQSDGDIRPKPKSFIRPVLGPTGPKKTDPVAKYFQYKQLWDMFKLPGENDRKALRWEIKERLAYQPPPPKPRKVLVPNTYTIPTEKKRSSLRWEIRNDLATGNLPHSYNYRF